MLLHWFITPTINIVHGISMMNNAFPGSFLKHCWKSLCWNWFCIFHLWYFKVPSARLFLRIWCEMDYWNWFVFSPMIWSNVPYPSFEKLHCLHVHHITENKGIALHTLTAKDVSHFYANVEYVMATMKLFLYIVPCNSIRLYSSRKMHSCSL